MAHVTTPAPRASRSGSDAADRAEPRALRTRVAVLDVVREALGEMPLGELTVAEICRRAGIHRVTFYGHWKDVDAAAADALTDVIDGISAIDEQAIAAAGDARSLAALYEDTQLELLAEFAEHRDAYRQMAESPLFGRKLREMLGHRAELAIAALVRTGVEVPGVASGIAAAQLSGGIAAATLLWLRSDAPDGPVDLAATAAELGAQLPVWWPRA
ncbi:TetR/AcrR family transcriptional regulator [Schumannella soli]|uniref:TetR/AcrR family transcriptional regulator n=1 Tax=Schumannella soli TaxID=2590779 RepID=A0A506XWQ7_9MICO|nr:TetR/AcrR family transcriptional regulator [Schumannella soli]